MSDQTDIKKFHQAIANSKHGVIHKGGGIQAMEATPRLRDHIEKYLREMGVFFSEGTILKRNKTIISYTG